MLRHVQEGNVVRQFDKIAEVQSDKATVEITSRFDGIIKKLHYEKGATAKVGQPLVDIDVEGDVKEDGKGDGRIAMPAAKLAEKQISNPVRNIEVLKHPPVENLTIKAMPGVRHFAKTNGVDIGKVRPSGKSGQITKEDVQKSMNVAIRANVDAAEYELVPLNAFQKAMERSMKAALNIPHFGFHDEILLNRLSGLRTSLLPSIELRYGVKVTVMSFFIKALSLALTDYPVLNSHFDEPNHSLKHYRAHNIGVAVDTAHGLAVPVIKNVQDLSVIEVARELSRLTEAARENRLSQTELGGGTITLSNIGSIGGTTASPIIVAPQVCIVAVGRTQVLPRFDENMQVTANKVMPISWSADHRVIDGATVARFSARWRNILEDTSTLLLHLY
ncbi:hypothetical protein PSACC_01669 [Paramicrosporidium saccamoebae]|uniref:Dihydrolipoamide acetyltransferase component of pyruvate dehydrogenase complex n=1 Tax=Paramicrosporidium saccamoebae TaxID=1246581 RepID=A0A2H9TL73_9FUNG|nr:hypothetical protein PSACC_01669 [Paramicrosporidium saccamoebae]